MQGVERPLYPFLAGVGELVARTVVCLFIPALINGGPITRQASDLAYIATASADVVSWAFANISLVLGYILFIKYLNKKAKANLF